jgi:hypothetical protein
MFGGKLEHLRDENSYMCMGSLDEAVQKLKSVINI